MGRNTREKDLSTRDRAVLYDLIRFGALTFEQLTRRFDMPGRRQLPQLERLKESGYVKKQPDWFSNTQFYAATDKAARALRLNWTPATPKPNWLPHDLTMAELADWLVAQCPGSSWRTERELMRGPRRAAQWGPRDRDAHRPDGVWIVEGRWIGIELELDWVNHEKYASVCRWFAAHLEFSGLHWYVRGQLLLERIPQIIERHGLAVDLDIRVFPIPDEVEVLAWPR